MIYQIDKYRIKPSKSRLDYEILEFRPVEVKTSEHAGEKVNKWVSTGKYASSFGHSLAIIQEYMLKDGTGVIDGLEDAIKQYEKITKKLMKQVELVNE